MLVTSSIVNKCSPSVCFSRQHSQKEVLWFPTVAEGNKGGKLNCFRREPLPSVGTTARKKERKKEGEKKERKEYEPSCLTFMLLFSVFSPCPGRVRGALGGPPPPRINWRIRATHARHPGSTSECSSRSSSRKEAALAALIIIYTCGYYLFLHVCKGSSTTLVVLCFFLFFF